MVTAATRDCLVTVALGATISDLGSEPLVTAVAVGLSATAVPAGMET